MPSRFSGELQLLAAALLFSTGGAVIKATTLSSWQIAGFRSMFAALVLAAIFPKARRQWTRLTLLVAVAYAATLILFVSATKLTTAANAVFLQATAPLYLLLLGPWLLKERLHQRDIVVLLTIGIGLSFFFVPQGDATSTSPDPFTGNVLAACSGLTWALTVAGLRAQERYVGGGSNALATVVAGNMLVFLFCLPSALPLAPLSLASWLPMVYLGICQVGLAYLLLTRGLQQVPALEASLILLVEPALNPVWTWLVHGERPGPWAIAGGGLILGATVVNTLTTSRSG